MYVFGISNYFGILKYLTYLFNEIIRRSDGTLIKLIIPSTHEMSLRDMEQVANHK